MVAEAYVSGTSSYGIVMRSTDPLRVTRNEVPLAIFPMLLALSMEAPGFDMTRRRPGLSRVRRYESSGVLSMFMAGFVLSRSNSEAR